MANTNGGKLITLANLETFLTNADERYWRKDATGSVLVYKGSVAAYANLPTDANAGDVYNVTAAYNNVPAGTNWAWSGTAWDPLGGTVDLSAYALSSAIPTKVSQLTNDKGYTSNTGTVTSVKVGSISYSPSSGVVSLPSYPTSLASPYKLTAGSKTYDGSAAVTITASDLGALTSHQSLANYVTLDGTQTISGQKTFSTVTDFTATPRFSHTSGAAWFRNNYYTYLTANNSLSSDITLTLPSKTGMLALTTDVPSNVVTLDEDQTITGNKYFQGDVGINDDEGGRLVIYKDNHDETTYGIDDITVYRSQEEKTITLTFPDVTGTILTDSDIVSNTGSSTTKIMSQKAVTNGLVFKASLQETNSFTGINNFLNNVYFEKGICLRGDYDVCFSNISGAEQGQYTIYVPDKDGTLALISDVKSEVSNKFSTVHIGQGVQSSSDNRIENTTYFNIGATGYYIKVYKDNNYSNQISICLNTEYIATTSEVAALFS